MWVVGTYKLARWIVGMPGVLNIDRTAAILKSAGQSYHEVHMLRVGTTRRRIFKRYIDNQGGHTGHFFARRNGIFDKSIS